MELSHHAVAGRQLMLAGWICLVLEMQNCVQQCAYSPKCYLAETYHDSFSCEQFLHSKSCMELLLTYNV